MDVEGNFALRPLQTQGIIRRYPLLRRLCGPKTRSGRFGEKTKLAPPPGICRHSINSAILSCPSHMCHKNTFACPTWISTENRAGPRHVGAPGHVNNLAPIKTHILYAYFCLGQRWRTFLKASAQTAANFRRNFLVCVWKLEFTSNIFLIIPVAF